MLARTNQRESRMTGYTPHQAKFFAHFVTREGIAEGDGLAQSLSAARVDLNPSKRGLVSPEPLPSETRKPRGLQQARGLRPGE